MPRSQQYCEPHYNKKRKGKVLRLSATTPKKRTWITEVKIADVPFREIILRTSYVYKEPKSLLLINLIFIYKPPQRR